MMTFLIIIAAMSYVLQLCEAAAFYLVFDREDSDFVFNGCNPSLCGLTWNQIRLVKFVPFAFIYLWIRDNPEGDAINEDKRKNYKR